ncbi:MAG TPA: methyltransferase [Polyangiaceae bacterium]|nr:methyltransferase [Polyangiaceae bacterium]
MSLTDRILGIPFVYDVIRPIVVGGIDMGQVVVPLSVRPSDVVVDVGCGTAVTLQHLPRFRRYVGFDTDERALAAAERRRDTLAPDQSGRVEFRHAMLKADAVRELAPDVVILAGILHHLDDSTCEELLRSLLLSPNLRSVVTLDVTFFPGRLVNNLFSILDRGQYPRHPGAYSWLAESAGFNIDAERAMPATPGNKRVAYWWMKLSPRAAAE